MGKPKKLLVMTVGTGEKSSDELVDGLCKSITQTGADFVVFFASDTSKNTVDRIKEQYYAENDNILDFCDTVEIKDDYVDDFDIIFAKLKDIIDQYTNDYNIVVNFTSGTKTMSMTAGLVSTLFNTELVGLKGKRGQDSRVKEKTGNTIHLNTYKYHDLISIRNIRELFNNNRFESGKILLKDTTGDLINKEAYLKLFDSYHYNDIVKFDEALKNFDIRLFVKEFPEFQEKFADNLEVLQLINKEEPRNRKIKDCYILANIINNAIRRSKEFKYDDAIARLYRSFELIAQIQLEHEYGIISNNIDVDKVEKIGVSEKYLNNLKRRKTPIKYALEEDYRLLSQFGDNLGKYFMKEHNYVRSNINGRNDSILAHGRTPLDKEKYERFLDLVLKFTQILDENFNQYLEKTEFPRFED